MDFEDINKQIIDLQKALSRSDIDEATRISYYDTLCFLLDTRALLQMKKCKGKESDDLSN